VPVKVKVLEHVQYLIPWQGFRLCPKDQIKVLRAVPHSLEDDFRNFAEAGEPVRPQLVTICSKFLVKTFSKQVQDKSIAVETRPVPLNPILLGDYTEIASCPLTFDPSVYFYGPLGFFVYASVHHCRALLESTT
jgi:hypothetical protein